MSVNLFNVHHLFFSSRAIPALRPKKLTLPLIHRPANHSESSPLFRRLSQDDLVSPDSHELVATWLFVHPDSSKPIEQRPRANSKSILEITDSLPQIDENRPKTLTNRIPDHHPVPLIDAHLHRTASPKPLSMSSTRSSSTRHASFVSHSYHVRFRTNSIEIPESSTGSSISKDRTTNLLTFLKFDSSLNESDQKKIEDIYHQLPEDFEEYLPTLIRLGVVHLQSKFFDSKGKDLQQRQRLMKIFQTQNEEQHQQRRRRRLFATSSPSQQENPRSGRLLRDNLSLQGQYSLLATYRDEIETELNKKLRLWKNISMRPIFPNPIDSTINTSNEVLSQDRIFSTLRPNQFDSQWKRRFLGKIIERGMKILDQVRHLPSTNSTKTNSDQSDKEEEEVVRTFKRWIFLWFSLFPEEN